MSPTDEALFQIYKETKGDRNLMEALFDDFEASQEYLDMLDKVRNAMIEPGSPEQIREEKTTRVVLWFEDLEAASRLDAIMPCLDIIYEQAREGKVDKYTADQIACRTELIRAAVALPVLNGAA